MRKLTFLTMTVLGETWKVPEIKIDTEARFRSSKLQLGTSFYLKILFGVCLILALLLVGCGGGGSPDQGEPAEPAGSPDQPATEGDAVAGETLFQNTCAACHGPDGKGLPNLGKDFTASEFVKGQSDAELVTFIKGGRPVSDPANTTGVDMPPKGGNPALSDEDLFDIVAYIRTLQE